MHRLVIYIYIFLFLGSALSRMFFNTKTNAYDCDKNKPQPLKEDTPQLFLKTKREQLTDLVNEHLSKDTPQKKQKCL